MINTLFKSNNNDVVLDTFKEDTNNEVTDELENKLKRILSMIEGAGKVEVMVSYISGIEQTPMYDEKASITVTEEKDKEGGQRKTEQTSNEKNVIYEEKNNNKSPVIKQLIMPEIMGVIVVSDGASNSVVKNNIIKAVEATVNVPSHRIQVFSKQK